MQVTYYLHTIPVFGEASNALACQSEKIFDYYALFGSLLRILKASCSVAGNEKNVSGKEGFEPQFEYGKMMI